MARVSVRDCNIGIKYNNTEGLITVPEGVKEVGREGLYGLLKNSSHGTFINPTPEGYLEVSMDFGMRNEDFNGFRIYTSKEILEESVKVYGSNDNKSFKEIQIENTEKGIGKSNLDKVFIFKDQYFFDYRYLKLELFDLGTLYTFSPKCVLFEDILIELENEEDTSFKRYSIHNLSSIGHRYASYSFDGKNNDYEIDYHIGRFASYPEEIGTFNLSEVELDYIDTVRENFAKKVHLGTTRSSMATVNTKDISFKHHSIHIKFDKKIMLNHIDAWIDEHYHQNQMFYPIGYYIKIGNRFVSPKGITKYSKAGASSQKSFGFQYEKDWITDEIVIEFEKITNHNYVSSFRMWINFLMNYQHDYGTYAFLKERDCTYEELVEESRMNVSNKIPSQNLLTVFGGYIKELNILKDGKIYGNDSKIFEVDIPTFEEDVYGAYIVQDGRKNFDKLKVLNVFDGYVYFINNGKMIKGEKYSESNIDYITSKAITINAYRNQNKNFYEYYINNIGKDNKLIILFEDENDSINFKDYKERIITIAFKTLNSNRANNNLGNNIMRNPYSNTYYKDNMVKIVKLTNLKRESKEELFSYNRRRSLLDELERREIELLTNQKGREDIDGTLQREYLGNSKIFKNKIYSATDVIDYERKE